MNFQSLQLTSKNWKTTSLSEKCKLFEISFKFLVGIWTFITCSRELKCIALLSFSHGRRSLRPTAIPTLLCKPPRPEPTPRPVLHRRTPEELQLIKEKHFWSLLTAPEFDLEKLDDSDLGWKVLPFSSSDSMVVLGKARFIWDVERQDYSAVADVIRLQKNCSFTLSSNKVVISPAKYESMLPGKIDSKRALSKVMNYDFAVASYCAPAPPAPVVVKKIDDFHEAVNSAVMDFLVFLEKDEITFGAELVPVEVRNKITLECQPAVSFEKSSSCWINNPLEFNYSLVFSNSFHSIQSTLSVMFSFLQFHCLIDSMISKRILPLFFKTVWFFFKIELILCRYCILEK